MAEAAQLQSTGHPYLAEGWKLVAIAPANGSNPGGRLPPLRISFATDTPIYPLRLKKVPYYADELRLQVLADHRMHVNAMTLQFAGRIEPRNQFLTTFTMPLTRPTSDLKFTQATSDDSYRAVLPRQKVIEIPVWLVVSTASALTIMITLTALTLIRRRNAHQRNT